MSNNQKPEMIEVYTRTSLCVKAGIIIPAGSVTDMTADEVKHFGKKVTRDIPEDAEKVKRA